MNHIKTLLIFISLFTGIVAFAPKDENYVELNKKGRLILKESGKEAFFWGVNYTAPFAHAFRQIERVGHDREEVINADTYHLSRLGINAYRIHVWDCEISDSLGNLLDNEHLRLLDYLIAKFQERGISVFLTPIAYWGNGYPERNEDLPGFSSYYNKGNVYTEPAAIAAQENYLKQFVNHKNPYTGKSYKNDPMVVGFEVCNEPGHSKPKETTSFVKKMISAIQSTGCEKPVYYNVTQSIGLLDDFIAGGTDGVTFQWYPTGLVSGHELKGNFLPNVDKYDMPFEENPSFANQARLVYEFDAADIGRSYMYPPIALSFKEAGMQWVTMFSYDPVAIAASNTEYQTHFLNLAYAPQKSIGFKIAGELFRNSKYERDRKNEKKPFQMSGVKIDYSHDLAELNTNELFYYTNNTSTKPQNISSLKSIAGYGNSSVVSSNGRGAYFLDKISDGIWRLEVMPDAIWVRDPFSRATPSIENVVIKWNKNQMTINLPDLGNQFLVTGINNGNDYQSVATEGGITLGPGAYLLSVEPVSEELEKVKIENITASEYFAPAETITGAYFLHTPVEIVTEKQSVDVLVDFVTVGHNNHNLSLHVSVANSGRRRWQPPVQIPMEKVDAYQYFATIPDSLVKVGVLNYIIKVKDDLDNEIIYPGEAEGPTTSWDYYNPESYSIKVIPSGAEVELFSAEDMEQVNTFIGESGLQSRIISSGVSGGTSLTIEASNRVNPRQIQNKSKVIFAMDNFVGETTGGIFKYADKYSKIVVRGHADIKPVKMELILVNKDGKAFSAMTTLMTSEKTQEIELDQFSKGKQFLLPRPYPGFLPFWYESPLKETFSLDDIERVQVVVHEEENDSKASFSIKLITLE